MRKMTFTIDEATAERLELAAERLDKAKSEVVREAIDDYADRIGRLSEKERRRMLRLFDEVVPRIPERSPDEVDRELEAIRKARESGGRGSTR